MTVGARDEFHHGNAGCSWTLDVRMRRATTSEGFSTVAARSAHRGRQRHFLTATPSSWCTWVHLGILSRTLTFVPRVNLCARNPAPKDRRQQLQRCLPTLAATC